MGEVTVIGLLLRHTQNAFSIYCTAVSVSDWLNRLNYDVKRVIVYFMVRFEYSGIP